MTSRAAARHDAASSDVPVPRPRQHEDGAAKRSIIITGVIVVVVCVAWFFLFYNPLRKESSDLGRQVDETRQQVTEAENELTRLKGYEKTSPQTRADLLRLTRCCPASRASPRSSSS